MTLKYYLVENQLTERKDDFMAHSTNHNSYSIEQVAERMLKRGTMLTKADILAVLEVYHTEVADIVTAGEGVHTPVFNISSSIAGVFTGASDSFDPTRHKININLNVGTLLRDAKKRMKTEKVSAPEQQSHISEVIDVKTKSVNDLLTPNRPMRILGQKLKVEGNDPLVGVYLVNANDPTQRSKVESTDIVTNNPSELVVVVPELAKGNYKLELTTQFSGGGNLLKMPRTTHYGKIFTVE
ncbi:MAG: DNA-binding domain-containing protein [Bacteroidales bacterium]